MENSFTKAEIPVAKPTSIEIARAGLLIISTKIVSPAGRDLYNVSVSEKPIKKHKHDKNEHH